MGPKSWAWAALAWGAIFVLPLSAQESRDSSSDGVVSLENLRDALIGAPAPSAGSAEGYSLWKNLSTPFLLPASRSRSAGREARRREGNSEGGLSVKLELDLPGSALKPGAAAYPRMLRELMRRTGFRPSPALSLDVGKSKAVVYGTIPAARYEDLIGYPGISRLEVGAADSCGEPRDPCSRMLLGIRMPAGISPREAWDLFRERLALSSGFTLEKVLGYQRIPSTSRMALVVLGRLPARNIGKLLADSDVVKIEPAPEPRVWAASIGPSPEIPSRFWEFLLSRYPARTLAILLLIMALAGFPSAPSKKSKR